MRNLLEELKSGLRLTSIQLYDMLEHPMYTYQRYQSSYCLKTPEMMENDINEYLKYDYEGSLRILFNNVKSQLNTQDMVEFFTVRILKWVTIKDLIVDEKMYELFKKICFYECNLDNVVFNINIENLQNKISDITLLGHMNLSGRAFKKVNNISMPQIHFNSWKDLYHYYLITNRESPFSVKTNLYLELDRKCNAKCKFCRNHCMEKINYDLGAIEQQIPLISKYVNSVVIGGGEPTVKREDLEKLLTLLNEYISARNIYIFSNGSDTKYNYQKIINQGANCYISRHSYDDKINSEILGLSQSKLLTYDHLHELSNNITLSCACINGGVDSVDKIIKYITKANSSHIRTIIFSNLQEDASVNLNDISYNNLVTRPELFDEAIKFLKSQGFYYTYPIVSTGGYEMYIMKRDHMKVIFKKYITKKEL